MSRSLAVPGSLRHRPAARRFRFAFAGVAGGLSMTGMTTTPGLQETRTASPEMRGVATDAFDERRTDERRSERQSVRETKPSLLATEFWFTVGGVAALINTYRLAPTPRWTCSGC